MWKMPWRPITYEGAKSRTGQGEEHIRPHCRALLPLSATAGMTMTVLRTQAFGDVNVTSVSSIGTAFVQVLYSVHVSSHNYRDNCKIPLLPTPSPLLPCVDRTLRSPLPSTIPSAAAAPCDTPRCSAIQRICPLSNPR
ncbi:hypothetical protein MSAN_00812100 [Mycena sanguinolenta]|uniref:Uncharacterized protein n=1 Tax=Mycena sanguinolenta TaxID=230812 RepID=A0A8H6YYV5_9AGAR|nr:hypothetical protein MSAN_00812100 [Mycena sanguinolenta]